MKIEKLVYSRWNFISFYNSSYNGIVTAATSVIFMILLLGLSSASAYPSDELQQHLPLSVGRNLLQVLEDCPIDIQNLNYTIITNRCKGPKYPANICCEAFKELACPYSPEINDIGNNCATTMFSYINLYGKYPPGLFANMCRDSKRGLECTDVSNSSNTATTPTTVLIFIPIFYWMFL